MAPPSFACALRLLGLPGRPLVPGSSSHIATSPIENVSASAPETVCSMVTVPGSQSASWGAETRIGFGENQVAVWNVTCVGLTVTPLPDVTSRDTVTVVAGPPLARSS